MLWVRLFVRAYMLHTCEPDSSKTSMFSFRASSSCCVSSHTNDWKKQTDKETDVHTQNKHINKQTDMNHQNVFNFCVVVHTESTAQKVIIRVNPQFLCPIFHAVASQLIYRQSELFWEFFPIRLFDHLQNMFASTSTSTITFIRSAYTKLSCLH